MTLGLAARLLAVATLCVQVTACSVANYRKPVDDFAQATRDTAAALAGLNEQVTDGYADLIRKRVVARQLLVRIEEGDCSGQSQRCRIIVVDKQHKVQPLSPDSAMGNMLILMSKVQSYADGLAGIVNVDTAAQVETQVNGTVGSLKNLADTIAKLAPRDKPHKAPTVNLADYATPVGNFFSWFAGQYIAKVQLDGLRRATVDARPVISSASEVFATAANESSQVPRALMAEEVSQRIDTLRNSLNERNVEEVAASAARYDRLLLGKPPAVFKQLQQSHEALVAKIQNENVSLAEVIARIEVFAAEAKELADIVKELQAVGKKKAEGQ
jgi:hypothetical protein